MKKGDTKYTREVLLPIVKKYSCMSDVVRHLTGKQHGKVHGSMLAYIKNKIIEFDIDFKHFNGVSKLMVKNIQKQGNTKEDILKFYFTNTPLKTTNNTNLKKYLYKFGFKVQLCEICGNPPIWNKIPLTLQLDHIDGVNTNNDLANLRILCPNCHSQTKTYAGKNRKIK